MDKFEKEFLMNRKERADDKREKRKPGQEKGKLVVEGTAISEEEYKREHEQTFGKIPPAPTKPDKLN